jgi:type II secretory pathway pseudopilin PulG
MAGSRCESASGFSMLEMIVATAMLAVSLVSLAQLLEVAARTGVSARTTTVATILAHQKMEQLRGLTWGYASPGVPVSDLNTNLADGTVASGCPGGNGAGSGTGLSPSPLGALSANTDGYVDYANAHGCTLGGGTSPPRGTIYVRRWSIEPLAIDPNNALVLQVLVTRRRNRGLAEQGNVMRAPEEARLVAIRTRKHP